MPDQKKPTDGSSTEESDKELDAEQLENVAGGLLPAPGATAFKFFRPNPTGDGSQEEPPTEISFVFHKID